MVNSHTLAFSTPSNKYIQSRNIHQPITKSIQDHKKAVHLDMTQGVFNRIWTQVEDKSSTRMYEIVIDLEELKKILEAEIEPSKSNG